VAEKKKASENSNTFSVKESDRVRRTDGHGCLGVIRELRQETAGTSNLVERSWLCQVQWDNGTLSYCEPELLEAVKK
jgi:hypothetical protein